MQPEDAFIVGNLMRNLVMTCTTSNRPEYKLTAASKSPRDNLYIYILLNLNSIATRFMGKDIFTDKHALFSWRYRMIYNCLIFHLWILGLKNA